MSTFMRTAPQGLKAGKKMKWLGLSAVVIALDQITKLWVVSSLRLHESIPLLPFFSLTYVQNTGAAFSFLAGAGGWQRWFFLVLAVAASAAILVWLWRLRENQGLVAGALSLVLGGALGNFIDRARLGYVIDFLDFHYQQWHWPAFNVADAAITCGVILLLWDSLTQPKQQREQ